MRGHGGQRRRWGRRRQRAFTLIELLVVIGIIALLMGMLMPALKSAMRQSKSVACQANLHSIGQLLLIYANNNKGVIYPIGSVVKPGEPLLAGTPGDFRTLGDPDYRDDGTPLPKEERWPAYVFDPPVWNPKSLLCPEDQDPVNEHSYVLNKHLEKSPQQMVKSSRSNVQGTTSTGEDTYIVASAIVVMGEKKSQSGEYYMDVDDYDKVVEEFRHGTSLGSNYLYLDWHAVNMPPSQVKGTLDPWQPQPEKTGP